MNIPVPMSQKRLERFLSVTSSNALDHFDQLMEKISSNRLIILLDYDGTLTPIVNDPSKAILDEDVRTILQLLSRHYTTGIVTGRSLTKIQGFVNLPDLLYAGSHGFDIVAPLLPVFQELNNGRNFSEKEEKIIRYQIAQEYLPTLQDIKRNLEEVLSTIPGAEVEDNLFSVSIHYRNCDISHIARIQEIVIEAKESNEGIRLKQGKMVFELQPDVMWNKGRAIEWVLSKINSEQIDFNERTQKSQPKVFTIFIGDDKTDEDAFELFNQTHFEDSDCPGVGILVSEESRPTHAEYTLRNPSEVAKLLQKFVDVGVANNLRRSPCQDRAQKSLPCEKS